MRFNIFDQKGTVKEPARVLKVREMIAHIRKMADAIENDLKVEAKGHDGYPGADLCDQCAAELAVQVLQTSAAVVQLFAQDAKIPPDLMKNEMRKGLIESLARHFTPRATPGFTAQVFKFETPTDKSQLN